MALVNDIKCARCDRKYSGVRSRCPYCGARRIGRGKYTEDADNAKGKMLISILILSVFTVAAGVMLFTTPSDSSGLPPNDSSISNPEDDIDNFPAIPIDDTPTPTPEVVDTPAPLVLERIQIHRTAQGGGGRVQDVSFWLSREKQFDLTSFIDPPGIDVSIEWSSSDEDVFLIEEVFGGVRLHFVGEGTARLVLTVGDMTDSCIIRVNP